MNINMINAIVRSNIDSGKRLDAFSFVYEFKLDALGQNQVTKLNVGKGDFLVTDIQISIYNATTNLVTNNGTKDLFTFNIENKSSGWKLFSGGKDIQSFVTVLNQNNRIAPFVMDSGAEYDLEINHKNIVDAGTPLALPITIIVSVDGARVK